MQNPSGNVYRAGDFYRICDRCGKKMHASRTAKEWTGLIVCMVGCLDVRNPQDFVRAKHDRQRVTDPRPEYMSEVMRIDLTSVFIDDSITLSDAVGDRFLDTNEVTAADL